MEINLLGHLGPRLAFMGTYRQSDYVNHHPSFEQRGSAAQFPVVLFRDERSGRWLVTATGDPTFGMAAIRSTCMDCRLPDAVESWEWADTTPPPRAQDPVAGMLEGDDDPHHRRRPKDGHGKEDQRGRWVADSSMQCTIARRRSSISGDTAGSNNSSKAAGEILVRLPVSSLVANRGVLPVVKGLPSKKNNFDSPTTSTLLRVFSTAGMWFNGFPVYFAPPTPAPTSSNSNSDNNSNNGNNETEWPEEGDEKQEEEEEKCGFGWRWIYRSARDGKWVLSEDCPDGAEVNYDASDSSTD